MPLPCFKRQAPYLTSCARRSRVWTGQAWRVHTPITGLAEIWGSGGNDVWAVGFNGLIVFSLLPAASFVLARRFAGDPNWKGWAPYSIITGVLVVVFFIASTAASVLDETGIFPGAPTGLLQRIGIIVGWGWIALLALRLLRQMRSPDSSARDALEADVKARS